MGLAPRGAVTIIEDKWVGAFKASTGQRVAHVAVKVL